MEATTIRTTCPRDCYDACGMLVKLSADGRINVVGDPEHSVSRGRVMRQMFDWLQRGLARCERAPDAPLEAGWTQRHGSFGADELE